MDSEWEGSRSFQSEACEAVVPEPKSRPKALHSEVTVADVIAVIDVLFATLVAVIGLLLVADSKVLAPAASGTFLLMWGIIRLLVAADRWFGHCGRPKDEVSVEAAAVKEVQRLAAVASAATAAADAERAAAAERLAVAERLADAERSAAAERLAEAEAMTNRLAKADAECADLAQRLNDSRADLDAAGAQTRRLREAGRVRIARCLRLAARLAVSRRRQRLASTKACVAAREHVEKSYHQHEADSMLPVATTPGASPFGVAEIGFSPQTPQHSACLAQKSSTPSTTAATQSPQYSSGALPESGTPSTAALLREAEPLLSAEAAEELGFRTSSPSTPAGCSQPTLVSPSQAPPATSAGQSPEKGNSAGTAGAPAAASRSELIARLTKMAAGNPEVRESLRERLKGASSVGSSGNAAGSAAAVATVGIEEQSATAPASEQDASVAATMPAASGSSHPATAAGAMGDGPPSPAADANGGSVRAEIVSRLNGLAAANEDLRAEWRARGEELSAASRDAAAMREVVTDQAREISHLRACRDALELHVTEVAAELRAGRQLAAAREVFEPVSQGPELSFNWVDDAWDWPGGAASSKGAERLRRSVGSRSAELSVGPPPVDWRTWLQLGLRRGQPSDPAILRLAIPGAEDASYIGLIWPVPVA